METILKTPILQIIPDVRDTGVMLIDVIGPHTLEAPIQYEAQLEQLMAVDKELTFITERHDGLVFITLEEM